MFEIIRIVKRERIIKKKLERKNTDKFEVEFLDIKVIKIDNGWIKKHIGHSWKENYWTGI